MIGRHISNAWFLFGWWVKIHARGLRRKLSMWRIVARIKWLLVVLRWQCFQRGHVWAQFGLYRYCSHCTDPKSIDKMRQRHGEQQQGGAWIGLPR